MSKIYSLLIALIVWGTTITADAQPIAVQNAFPNVGGFTQPIFLTHSGDGSDRIFVAQKNGFIYVFNNDSTVSTRNTFLNISNKIITGGGGDERGLLGLAFHPNYSSNGYFYVNYSAPNPHHTVISRFQVSSGNPNKADSLSEQIIMEIYQPYSNHNGGMIFFGDDGYLYIGMGDGGSAGDPLNRAQNLDSLLGKILRINVDTTVGPQNYGIPPTNPYVGGGGRPEIFASGIRNPWRMSQDPVTGFIYCGDVGQGSWEEIDIIESGKNYGWRCYEGNNPYNTSGCGPQGNYTFPISAYGSNSPDCSVTGGYVYRGTRRPELVGRYIYSDYCSGRIRKLFYNGSTVSEEQILLTQSSILSFGVDQQNELYMCANNGTIYRFNLNTSVGITNNNNGVPSEYSLEQNYPNPFNPTTSIRYSLPEISSVKLTIFNSLGKEVRTLVNTTQSAGNYERQWDGKDNNGLQVSSGVYFYTLSSDNFTDSKKMLLLK